MPNQCWQRVFLGLINTTAGGIYFFLSLYFVKDLHMNIARAGIIISFYGVGRMCGGIIGGKAADRFSPTKISIICMLIESIAFIALVRLHTFIPLIINVFVYGVAMYGFNVSNKTWVLKQTGDSHAERLKAINILYTATNMGVGLAAVIVSIFADKGFHEIFIFSGVLLFVAAIYLISNHRKFLHRDHLTQNTRASSGLSSSQKKKFSKTDRIVFIVTLLSLFLIGLVVIQHQTTYTIYLHEFLPQIGIRGVGLIYAINPILIVFFQVPLVNRFKESNKVMLTGYGAFMMGAGTLMLVLPLTVFIAIISAIIYTVGEMLFMPVTQLICYQRADENKKGQGLGMYQTVYAASVVVGPAVGGVIYHKFGGDLLWYFSGVIGFICLLLGFYFKKFER